MQISAPLIRVLLGVALVLSVLGGCGKKVSSTPSSPATAGGNSEATPGVPAPVLPGNAEGYLGPHTAGISIPVRPDQNLLLGEVRGAAQRCFVSLLENVRLQLFRGAFDLDSQAQRLETRYLPGRGSAPLSISFGALWRAFPDFPLPPPAWNGQVIYPVAIAQSEIEAPIPALEVLLIEDPVEGARLRRQTLELPAGLAQLVYERAEDATARTPDSMWVENIEVRQPKESGMDVPWRGTGDGFEGATINTVEYEDCLLNETLRSDLE